MIESIQFKNFKALRDTTLPLSPCTILVGPNGSGKSTVLQALAALSGRSGGVSPRDVVSADLREDREAEVRITAHWAKPHGGIASYCQWRSGGFSLGNERRPHSEGNDASFAQPLLNSIRVFSFDASAIAAPVQLKQNMELVHTGAGLAGVLDRLRDQEPERFEAVNEELGRWLPEFDRVLFNLDSDGKRLVSLRTRDGHHSISAAALSQGTLIALTILTLAHLPNPPAVVGLEEPDRGIHPYLLRHVQDAIYRLSNPEASGEDRDPVQVIATTHSPYFLNLFKDFPEEIVVANKVGGDVQFQRMTDQPHFEDILGDAPLGEAWFTGFLGGVPSGS